MSKDYLPTLCISGDGFDRGFVLAKLCIEADAAGVQLLQTTLTLADIVLLFEGYDPQCLGAAAAYGKPTFYIAEGSVTAHLEPRLRDNAVHISKLEDAVAMILSHWEEAPKAAK